MVFLCIYKGLFHLGLWYNCSQMGCIYEPTFTSRIVPVLPHELQPEKPPQALARNGPQLPPSPDQRVGPGCPRDSVQPIFRNPRYSNSIFFFSSRESKVSEMCKIQKLDFQCSWNMMEHDGTSRKHGVHICSIRTLLRVTIVRNPRISRAHDFTWKERRRASDNSSFAQMDFFLLGHLCLFGLTFVLVRYKLSLCEVLSFYICWKGTTFNDSYPPVI